MTDKPDLTDDWMNPPSSSISSGFRAPQPGDPMEYLIERKRRIITFGDALYEWALWAKYDTAEARDAELVWLRKEHPNWQLRTRDVDPYREYIMGSTWGASTDDS